MKAVVDLLALGLVRLLVFLIAWLPGSLGFELARGLVSGILLCLPRTKSAAERNLEIAFPDKSNSERQRIFAESKLALVRNIFHFARAPRYSKEELASMFDYQLHEAAFEACRAKAPDVGVLAATMHFGNFELFVYGHPIHYQPIWILARGFGLEGLDNWWNARREEHGNKVFARKGGYREIVRQLAAGEDVTLLCDQNVKGNHAVFVDFFGVKAATTKAIALAALRTGSRVLLSASCQIEPGRNKVFAEELPHPSEFEGTKDEKIEQFSTAMNAAMERIIREYPEHWFWIHRRWKTRPPGEAETLYA